MTDIVRTPEQKARAKMDAKLNQAGWKVQSKNEIDSFIRGIEANLGSRSHLAPDSWTLVTAAKRSESPRWR